MRLQPTYVRQVALVSKSLPSLPAWYISRDLRSDLGLNIPDRMISLKPALWVTYAGDAKLRIVPNHFRLQLVVWDFREFVRETAMIQDGIGCSLPSTVIPTPFGWSSAVVG